MAHRFHLIHPSSIQKVDCARWQRSGLAIWFKDGCFAIIPPAEFADVSPDSQTTVEIAQRGPAGLWLTSPEKREFFPWDWLRYLADPVYRVHTAAYNAGSFAPAGAEVRAWRLAHKWSRWRLAAATGLADSTIARLERGHPGVFKRLTLLLLTEVMSVDHAGKFIPDAQFLLTEIDLRSNTQTDRRGMQPFFVRVAIQHAGITQDYEVKVLPGAFPEVDPAAALLQESEKLADDFRGDRRVVNTVMHAVGRTLCGEVPDLPLDMLAYQASVRRASATPPRRHATAQARQRRKLRTLGDKTV